MNWKQNFGLALLSLNLVTAFDQALAVYNAGGMRAYNRSRSGTVREMARVSIHEWAEEKGGETGAKMAKVIDAAFVAVAGPGLVAGHYAGDVLVVNKKPVTTEMPDNYDR